MDSFATDPSIQALSAPVIITIGVIVAIVVAAIVGATAIAQHSAEFIQALTIVRREWKKFSKSLNTDANGHKGTGSVTGHVTEIKKDETASGAGTMSTQTLAKPSSDRTFSAPQPVAKKAPDPRRAALGSLLKNVSELGQLAHDLSDRNRRPVKSQSPYSNQIALLEILSKCVIPLARLDIALTDLSKVGFTWEGADPRTEIIAYLNPFDTTSALKTPEGLRDLVASQAEKLAQAIEASGTAVSRSHDPRDYRRPLNYRIAPKPETESMGAVEDVEAISDSQSTLDPVQNSNDGQ